MLLNHHPDTSTILAYAAGAVTEGLSLVLAAHFELCSQCRADVNEAEHIGGDLFSRLPPSSLSRNSLAKALEAIAISPGVEQRQHLVSDANDLPVVLHPFFPTGLAGVNWRRLMPGFKQQLLEDVDSGNGSIRLLHISPGAKVPQHTHLGSEVTLVLQGSYSDETGHYRRGDLSDLDPSVLHQPVVDSEQPCICLIATDERLQFSGALNRMIRPLIGI